jgi:ribulose-phosphate 3-epimerase
LFHLDIMDGVFVPNISFGIPVIKAISKFALKPLDVHLMIIHPEQYFKEFCEAGANILSIHYEASTHLHRSLQQIRDLGMQAGVVLNPHTPVHLLEDVINEAYLFLIMSVNPGFGGQKFIEQTYARVQKLRELITKSGSKALIEVDGGVDLSNCKKLVNAGADILVAGNTVFSSVNPALTIANLKNC